jgi:hypothetical protein
VIFRIEIFFILEICQEDFKWIEREGEGKRNEAVWFKASTVGGAIATRVSEIIFQFNSHCDYPFRPVNNIRGPPPQSRNSARIITTPSLLPLSSHPSPTPPRLPSHSSTDYGAV